MAIILINNESLIVCHYHKLGTKQRKYKSTNHSQRWRGTCPSRLTRPERQTLTTSFLTWPITTRTKFDSFCYDSISTWGVKICFFSMWLKFSVAPYSAVLFNCSCPDGRCQLLGVKSVKSMFSLVINPHNWKNDSLDVFVKNGSHEVSHSLGRSQISILFFSRHQFPVQEEAASFFQKRVLRSGSSVTVACFVMVLRSLPPRTL